MLQYSARAEFSAVSFMQRRALRDAEFGIAIHVSSRFRHLCDVFSSRTYMDDSIVLKPRQLYSQVLDTTPQKRVLVCWEQSAPASPSEFDTCWTPGVPPLCNLRVLQSESLRLRNQTFPYGELGPMGFDGTGSAGLAKRSYWISRPTRRCRKRLSFSCWPAHIH